MLNTITTLAKAALAIFAVIRELQAAAGADAELKKKLEDAHDAVKAVADHTAP